METLPQMLARNVALVPDRAFLVSDRETLTYAAFDARCARLAHVLHAAGVGAGDVIGLYLPSTPDMAIGFWACQRLGAIPAPISAMLRHAELEPLLARAGLRALIVDASTAPYFADIAGRFAHVRTFHLGDRAVTAALAAAPAGIAQHPAAARDVAALFFTSGTTGLPKGIAQSHFATCASLRDMSVMHRARFGREIYLCGVPLFTNLGMTVTINLAMYTGGTVILMERWDTERALADIHRFRATQIGGTPTMFVHMVNAFDAARHDLTSLRVATTGGSPVPQPVMQRFEELSGVRVTQVYGATETLGQSVMEPTIGLRRPGSAGLPVGSARVTIADDDDRPLPAGEIGEIIIGGDTLADGYWRDPQATAAAFGHNGWRSGDLGYVDADGYLYIVDRKKDVIFTGGHNIYPLELETALYRHPAVALCAVVPAPDAERGEVPVAVVVLKPEMVATAEDLRLWSRQHLAAYKAPRRVEIIDDMPVEAAKIRKRELVEALKAGSLDRYRRS